MQGFKEFILKGNLVELAVAFIMATAFAAVVTAFTGVLMGFIGKAGGQPDFSDVNLAEVNVGIFLNALISFLIIAMAHFQKEDPPATKTDEVLVLEQIRDQLAARPLS